MSILNPISWRKMQILKEVIQKILTKLSALPNASTLHPVQALLAREEVLSYTYIQLGPFMQNLLSDLSPFRDPIPIALDLSFATLYSRYLALASACIDLCSTLDDPTLPEIMVTVREDMEHYAAL